MEETTTPNPTENQGVDTTTQPSDSVGNEAATTQPQPTEQTPTQVDETVEWLQKKGLDREDPEYLAKLEKMAFNSEKLMTKATQEASALKNAMSQPQQPISGNSGVDPLLSGMAEFISDYNRDKMISSFKTAHPDWSQYDSSMGKLLNQTVDTPHGVFTRSQLVNEGLLSLEDIYVMAKGSSPIDTQTIKEDAKTEVLQTLANTQRAGGATPNASNSTPKPKDFDPVIEGIRRSRGQ